MYESYASYSSGSGNDYDGSDLLTGNDATSNGSTNYSTDTGTTGSTGGVINSSANPITTNSGPVDASGGNGSIPTGLQNIATQGLNDAVTSATEFGLGSLTDLLRVGAQGTTTAAAAPSPQGSSVTASSGVPTWLLLAGGALILFMVLKAK